MSQLSQAKKAPALDVVLEEVEVGGVRQEGVPALVAEDFAGIAARLNLLEGFFRLATKEISFQEFMREILLAVMRMVKCEAGSILEINHRRGHFFFRAAVGYSSDRIATFLIPVGKGIVGYVAESRQPLIASNLDESREHLRAIQEAIGFDAKNIAAFPIIIRGRVFGVLELLNRVGELSFTEADCDLLRQTCDYVSKIIEIRLMVARSGTGGIHG